MFAGDDEEDTELRDLIVENLENCGFLNKIKAELRAGVLMACNDDGNLRQKISLFNKKFDDFAATAQGKLAVSIVREFLEYFNLHLTLAVYDPEIALLKDTRLFNRTDLCTKFNFSTSDLDGPILCALLKDEIPTPTNGSSPQSLNPEVSISSTSGSLKSVNVSSDETKSKVVANGAGNMSSPFSSVESLVKSKKVFGPRPMTNHFTDPLKANEVTIQLEQEKLSDAAPESLTSKEENSKNTFSSDFTSSVTDSSTETASKTPELNQKSSENVDTPIEANTNIPNNKAETDIFKTSSTDSIFKTDIFQDKDPFFDEPLPSDKSPSSFFGLPKDSHTNKMPFNLDNNNSLTSLKNLPSLATKSTDWTFEKHPNHVSKGLESNEESSERKNDSDESIEEEIDEESSIGMEDLLNSSLSMADDATTDHTVSQTSNLDGVDHMEKCLSN